VLIFIEPRGLGLKIIVIERVESLIAHSSLKQWRPNFETTDDSEETNLKSNCDGTVSRATAEPRGRASQTSAGWLTRGVSGLRAVAPYAAIELLLPGGSLIAFGLWLFQRKIKKMPTPANSLVSPTVIAPGAALVPRDRPVLPRRERNSISRVFGPWPRR
jgi:hypothetical protein